MIWATNRSKDTRLWEDINSRLIPHHDDPKKERNNKLNLSLIFVEKIKNYTLVIYDLDRNIKEYWIKYNIRETVNSSKTI